MAPKNKQNELEKINAQNGVLGAIQPPPQQQVPKVGGVLGKSSPLNVAVPSQFQRGVRGVGRETGKSGVFKQTPRRKFSFESDPEVNTYLIPNATTNETAIPIAEIIKNTAKALMNRVGVEYVPPAVPAPVQQPATQPIQEATVAPVPVAQPATSAPVATTAQAPVRRGVFGDSSKATWQAQPTTAGSQYIQGANRGTSAAMESIDAAIASNPSSPDFRPSGMLGGAYRGQGYGVAPRPMQVVSIDTGIRAGSREAAERQARLDAQTGGDIIGGGDRQRALAMNRVPMGRPGVLNKPREAMQMAREERATRGVLAAERAKANALLAAEQFKAATELDRTNREIAGRREVAEIGAKSAKEIAQMSAAEKKAMDEAQKQTKGIRFDGTAWIGPDGKPLDDASQTAWNARRAILSTVKEPETIRGLQNWRQNPKDYSVMIDRQSGRIVVLPNKDGWGEPNWKGESYADGGKEFRRYVAPFEADPIVGAKLREMYGV